MLETKWQNTSRARIVWRLACGCASGRSASTRDKLCCQWQRLPPHMGTHEHEHRLLLLHICFPNQQSRLYCPSPLDLFFLATAQDLLLVSSSQISLQPNAVALHNRVRFKAATIAKQGQAKSPQSEFGAFQQAAVPYYAPVPSLQLLGISA